MRTQHSRLLLGLGLLGCCVALATASTPSPVQSNSQPLGLPLIGKVQLSGSDAQAQAFEAVKASYIQTVNAKLPERVAFNGAGLNQLDPQRLYFTADYAPRVYFIYEGACYTNALGATIATASKPTDQPLQGNTFTIFPNTHSSISYICASN